MSEPVAIGVYPGITIEYHQPSPKKRFYTVNSERVPSVTEVLGVLDKPALPYWAAKVTAEGIWKVVTAPGYKVPDRPFKLHEELKAQKLDHQSISKRAAERGVNVHQILQDWAERQVIPNTSDYPAHEHGYIRGLSRWLMEEKPEFVESEMVVGSAVHGFAGRLDTVAVVKHADRGRCMFDLKTSKKVYRNSMFPQLAAYELAAVECGQEPTDAQAIVRVDRDGSYEVAWSDATADDFLAVLGAWKSQQKWGGK